MAALPVDPRLKIERLIEDEVVQGEMRDYLGLSQIGKECPRFLWYDFRFCSKKKFSARIARLFQRGHREEPIIVADLKKAGVKVFSPQECKKMGYDIVEMSNGERQIEVTAGYGHIKGHGDGLGLGIPDDPKTNHYLEFKTVKEEKTTKKAKNKHFDLLREVGLEEYSPVYWAQCQTMMRLMKLTRTLFIAANKNDDSRYYERLRLNITEADDILRRGQDIILSEFPPMKADSYKCNWCDHRLICLQGAEPQRNCRTCQYCDMENKGRWSCSEREKNGQKHWLHLKEQIVGCPDWRKMNGLGG